MENIKSKKGLAPSSSKERVSSDMTSDKETPSLFKLEDSVKKELREQGLVWRFIFAKAYTENHGFHRSGWKPHQFAKPEKTGKFDFGAGIDAEGYLRRGDQVLAVKTIEAQAAHKAQIQRRNDAYGNYNKQAAAKLRAETNLKVFEGYDENDEAKSVGDESDD